MESSWPGFPFFDAYTFKPSGSQKSFVSNSSRPQASTDLVGIEGRDSVFFRASEKTFFRRCFDNDVSARAVKTREMEKTIAKTYLNTS